MPAYCLLVSVGAVGVERNGKTLTACQDSDAGRKQYIYHEVWRRRQDQAKFDHMLDFAAMLPTMRAITLQHLQLEGQPREKTLGLAVRLLDRGFFRIGSEGYAEENQSYGLATIQKRHVTIRDSEVIFDYRSKSGRRRIWSTVDPARRASARSVKEVAHYLGDTPAVCRTSYIDPRVFDRYRSGWTISLDSIGEGAESGEPATQGPIEEAVVDLIEDRRRSPALERIAGRSKDRQAG